MLVVVLVIVALAIVVEAEKCFVFPWFSFSTSSSLSHSGPSQVSLFCYSATRGEIMSRNGKSPKLDLKLNLSPPRVNPRLLLDSPNRSVSMSPTSSCVSSEMSPDETQTLRYSNSPEATSMLLVGCPRCLMYVMLSEKDPKCPKCKSTVLLDFLRDTNITTTNSTKKKSRRD